MNKTFAILLASTVLAVGSGLSASSAMHRDARPETSRDQAGGSRVNMMFASDDDGVDRDHGRRIRRADDDDHHDQGGDEDDNDDGGGASAGPAPAGTVAPPANGLFGSGTVPKVKVN